MFYSVVCPHCRNHTKAPEGFLGKRVRCKRCNQPFFLKAGNVPPPRPTFVQSPPTATALPDSVMETVMATPQARSPAGTNGFPAGRQAAFPPAANPPAATPAANYGLPPAPAGVRDTAPSSGRGNGRRFVYLGLLAAALLVAGAGVGASFMFLPARPIKANKSDKFGKYACIEIGSSSVKMVVADFMPEEDVYSFDIIARDEEEQKNQTNLAKSVAKDLKSFDPKVLDKAVGFVKDYYKKCKDDAGVPPDRIYIVCSSGVFAKIAEADRYDNEADIKTRVREAIGKRVTFVDEADQARCCLLACALPKQRSQALILDLGGNHTLGGYMDDKGKFHGIQGLEKNESKSLEKNEIKTLDKIGPKNYAKDLEKEAKKQNVERLAIDELNHLRAEALRKPLQTALALDKELGQQNKVYLIGGCPYAMTTYMRPEEIKKIRDGQKEFRVRLSAKDVLDFRNQVAKKGRVQLHQAALNDAGKDPNGAVEKELQKVEQIFTEVEVRAVAEILLTLSEEFDFKGKTSVTFMVDSQFAFALGHIITMSEFEQ